MYILFHVYYKNHTKYVIWNIEYEICSKYTQITIIIKMRGGTILLGAEIHVRKMRETKTAQHTFYIALSTPHISQGHRIRFTIYT